LLLLLCGNALVVFFPPNATEHVFDHVTATNFGPSVYDVTGSLIIAEPEGLCELNPTFDPFDLIVLILRGNCTFYIKALNAQSLGAKAVVIANPLTDTSDSTNDFISIGASKGMDVSLIHIPTVSITSLAFNTLVSILRLSSPTLPPAQANATNAITAQLNHRGEVFLSTSEWSLNSIKTAGIILLILPGLWFVAATFFIVRKSCIAKHNRISRTAHARRIPTIQFTRVATRQNRIHNETCPICLDDFVEGRNVKILPCKHGFHSECVDPWLNDRSDLCPICKKSIIVHSHGRRCSECWSRCRGRADGFEPVVDQVYNHP